MNALVRHPSFGDRVRNTSASETNPTREGIFVRVVRVTGKLNRGIWYECTDGKGRFWQTDPRSIIVLANTTAEGRGGAAYPPAAGSVWIVTWHEQDGRRADGIHGVFADESDAREETDRLNRSRRGLVHRATQWTVTPNAAGEVRRNAVTSTGLLADESKGE